MEYPQRLLAVFRVFITCLVRKMKDKLGREKINHQANKGEGRF